MNGNARMFGGRVTGKSWRIETIIGNQNSVVHKGIIMTPDAPSRLIFDILALIRLNEGKA